MLDADYVALLRGLYKYNYHLNELLQIEVLKITYANILVLNKYSTVSMKISNMYVASNQLEGIDKKGNTQTNKKLGKKVK